MHRIKVCSIPEIFCIVYRQKHIVAKKATLGMFLYQDEMFGDFSVKESRARGLLSILISGFNRLVQSCPIV